MNMKKSSTNAKLQGVCITMCPTQERIMRTRENLYHPLECKVDARGKRTNFPDTFKFVKEYSRPAADQSISPFTVRPLPILQKTVNYLLAEVASCEDISWREVYDFVSDRLRAIQKDITVQDLFVEESLNILAPSARFLLYAHYRLCELSHPEFDSFLNLKQLNHTLLNINYIFKKFDYKNDLFVGIKEDSNENLHFESTAPEIDGDIVMQNVKSETQEQEQSPDRTSNGTSQVNDTLDDICDQIKSMGVSNGDPSPSEQDISQYSIMEEMMSLYLLVNLGNEEAIMHVLDLPASIRKGALLTKILNGCIWWLSGNHFPLLRLVPTLPPLFCCAIHLHLNKIQRHALGVMSVAYNAPNLKYKLKDLVPNLLSSTSTLEESCVHYGLSVSGEEIQFKKSSFNWDASLMKPAKTEWLESKLSSLSTCDILLPPTFNN